MFTLMGLAYFVVLVVSPFFLDTEQRMVIGTVSWIIATFVLIYVLGGFIAAMRYERPELRTIIEQSLNTPAVQPGVTAESP